MALQLDTVFIWVTNVDASLDWYSKIGFETGPRFGPWQNMITDGETNFALHEGIRDEGRATAIPSFRVDDLQVEIDRLARAGLFSTDAEVTDTGMARFTTFTDPDGNDIQLLERY